MSDRMEESIQEVYSENDKETGRIPEQEEPMGILGWIHPEEYSFDCMLRMERFQIAWMLDNPYSDTDAVMAAALKANPKVAWVFEHKCPEMAG